MKYYFLFSLCLIGFQVDLFAQHIKSDADLLKWQKAIGDEWFNSHIDAALKPGDHIPADLLLGNVMNNPKGYRRFSDLKGKLVILDFWTTTCSNCIEAFPKMEKLQEQFKDNIQIFLVNPWESENDINVRMHSYYKGSRLPDLPILTGKREDLQVLFPARGVPNHVWVEGNGIVQLVGSNINTESEKITAFLNKKRSFPLNINNLNNTPKINANLPYYMLLNKKVSSNKYYSFFEHYNNDYSAGNTGSEMAINQLDTLKRTIRNTFINPKIFGLYEWLFKDSFSDNKYKLIWSPGIKQFRTSTFDRYQFALNDSLYNAVIQSLSNNTPEEYVKFRLCYEQISPISMSEQQRRDSMLRDLNDFLIFNYGLNGAFDTCMRKCYVLVCTSNNNRLNKAAQGIYNKKEELFIEGKKMIHHTGVSLSTVISKMISGNMGKNGFQEYIIDETSIDYLVDINYPDPSEINDIEQLRKILNVYGLDLVIKTRRFNVIKFTELQI